MVKAKSFWPHPEHSAHQFPGVSCMNGSLAPNQLECLSSCTNPGAFMFGIPQIPSLKTEQKYETNEFVQSLPSHFQSSVLSPGPSLQEAHFEFSSGLGHTALPTLASGSFQKGFLIFDQSRNETRVMYSCLRPHIQIPSTVTAHFGSIYHDEEHVARDTGPKNYSSFHKESSENCIDDKEWEMHEDTEEINALLYSDDDSDYNSDDDEVASTGHSPMPVIGNYEKQEQFQEINEEIASSGGPRKRQRVLDGGFIESSPLDTATSVKVDVELIHASGQREEQNEVGSGIDHNLPSRKDKILESLRVFESIVPGAKGKELFFIIDKAIDYLESLKYEATKLGVTCH